MNFYIMTLFPEMVMEVLNTSILKRAMDKGTIFAKAVNIRDYADNKHNKVDDYTYGGGAGMLMQAQPIYSCYQAILNEIREREPDAKPRVVYVTPQGSVFSQAAARDFAKDNDIIFLCGHYEGIDERVLEEIVTDYVSIGDYVLTGGELPAMVMIDAISRLVPGVLNNEESAQTESFDDGLLEYPQYSRPEVWMDKRVPSVLLSGNHANVDVWRFQKSLERTRERRPELYDKYIEEHPEQFTPKALKKRNKILDRINEEM
ncbi:tRNA (guanosine(37)-N1)-methyltransferase TrmD [Butyrivibrio sp. WCE2006]|uniref:tRNA (guanosine(37)-N1)-methyltransferase TrmD n=1 Tax=Butyrivibrio sp. WCE2006 TaxID=1410611 RepID=UPI0005D1C139|nr:tRNA (guanosine(37)-N1)-methyltransferase TrmD [Butyrivibrio sp. WCE2006]